MTSRPADPGLLVECARRLAALIDAPVPDDVRIRQVIAKVVDKRGAIENAESGLITKDEAVSLLLAHYQSDLFTFPGSQKDAQAWADPGLLGAMKRGLFGAGGGD